MSLVVAINKVDLPNANVNRTRQQLYGLNVLPDNMGGDTPFVETSAATGKGIDELLDQNFDCGRVEGIEGQSEQARSRYLPGSHAQRR